VTVETVGGTRDTPRVLRAAGELDVSTVPPLLPQVADLVAGASGVVFDLSAVTFLDSSGVRLVDQLGQECARRNTPYRVVAPPASRARRVLEIVGFGPPIIADDLPSALAAVRTAAS
jgi:anti-sigma B factor antagonist